MSQASSRRNVTPEEPVEPVEEFAEILREAHGA